MNSKQRMPTRPSAEVEKAFGALQDQKARDITRQITLADQRLATLQAKRKEYLDEVALLKQQTKAYEMLDRSGAIPQNDVLEAQRRIASTETLEQLAKVTSEKAELQSVLGRQLGELERLQVRSPVDEIVKSDTIKPLGVSSLLGA